jgi:hypothetical protein
MKEHKRALNERRHGNKLYARRFYQDSVDIF